MADSAAVTLSQTAFTSLGTGALTVSISNGPVWIAVKSSTPGSTTTNAAYLAPHGMSSVTWTHTYTGQVWGMAASADTRVVVFT